MNMIKCGLIQLNNTSQSTELDMGNGTDGHNLLQIHQMKEQTSHYI